MFLPTDTFWGVLENAAVGVLAGVFSFIGSIGIVPFAAALWFGGAGFAAVLGVIVSDTITLPVLNLWKSFFGGRATAYIFGAFYSAMVLSTVAIEYLFRSFGWLPTPAQARVRDRRWVEDRLHAVDHHRILSADRRIVAGSPARAPRRRGGGHRPVCGVSFEQREAEATEPIGDGTAFFCSAQCAGTFRKTAGQVAAASRSGAGTAP